MSIGDDWKKIEYKGEDAKKFEFLIKLLTPPAWFSFSKDHKECRARFHNYGWYCAEKELARVLSYLNVGDSILATVEFDLTIDEDDLKIKFTKEKDGKVSIERNMDYSYFSYDGYAISHYIENLTDKEHYDFSMEQYIRRIATLVGDNSDYLDIAYEMLVDKVIFFETECSKASFKEFLQKRRCEPWEIEEEELFYDYFATPLNPLVYKMPFTLLDRLGGVFEFNRELVKKKRQANSDLFEEAVKSLANGKPGDNGIHGELTERIRNGKDHYPDIPDDIKSLPLNVLYELGGPHKVSRYINRFGRDHFINQAKEYFGYGMKEKFEKLLYPISLSKLLNKKSKEDISKGISMDDLSERIQITLDFWEIDGGSDVEIVEKIFQSNNKEKIAFLFKMIDQYGCKNLIFSILLEIMNFRKSDYTDLETYIKDKLNRTFISRENSQYNLKALWTSRGISQEKIEYLEKLLQGQYGDRIKGLIKRYGVKEVLTQLENEKNEDGSFNWERILRQCTKYKDSIITEAEKKLVPLFDSTYKKGVVDKNRFYQRIYLIEKDIESLTFSLDLINLLGYNNTKHKINRALEFYNDNKPLNYNEFYEKIIEQMEEEYKINEKKLKSELTKEVEDNFFDVIEPWIFYKKKNENDIDLKDLIEFASNPNSKKYYHGIGRLHGGLEKKDYYLQGFESESETFKKIFCFVLTCMNPREYQRSQIASYFDSVDVSNMTILGVPFEEACDLERKPWGKYETRSNILSKFISSYFYKSAELFTRIMKRIEKQKEDAESVYAIYDIDNHPLAQYKIISIQEVNGKIILFETNSNGYDNPIKMEFPIETTYICLNWYNGGRLELFDESESASNSKSPIKNIDISYSKTSPFIGIYIERGIVNSIEKDSKTDSELYHLIKDEAIKRYQSYKFDIAELLEDSTSISVNGDEALDKLHKFFSNNRFDVEKFLTEQGINIECLKGKDRTGYLLYLLGYFMSDKNTLNYRDIFSESFIPVLKEGKFQRAHPTEEKALKKYGINVTACKIDAWLEYASIMDKLKVPFKYKKAAKLHFDEIVNDNQIRADEDLLKKMNYFKDEALKHMLIDDFSQLIITCYWKKKENGEMFCTQIEGEMDEVYLSINYENGEVNYYRKGEYDDISTSSTFYHI